MEEGLHEHAPLSSKARTTHVLFYIFFLAFQIFLIVFFFVFAEYGEEFSTLESETDSYKYYQKYLNIAYMMFIGFGFLMTFMRRYAFGAVGYTFLLTAWIIEYGLLFIHFTECIGTGHWVKLKIGFPMLIKANFCAAAILISYGAVLGKLSLGQLMWMAFFEVIAYCFNVMVCEVILHVADIGGSILIHTFGAYFGLTVATVLNRRSANWQTIENHRDEFKSQYLTDVFAMIGTIFLWLYWPSFNGALAPEKYFHRCVVNTLLSLVGANVMTFFFSRLYHHHKFDMVDIQNATLAGGIAIGASADYKVLPGGALLIGSIAGVLSTTGYKVVTPFLERKIKLHDTCGVHNLHGMPGIYGTIVSAFASGIAFYMRHYTPEELKELFKVGNYQWAIQLASLGITLGIAIVSGILVALGIMSFSPSKAGLDSFEWESPYNFDMMVSAPAPVVHDDEDLDKPVEESPVHTVVNQLATPAPTTTHTVVNHLAPPPPVPEATVAATVMVTATTPTLTVTTPLVYLDGGNQTQA